MARINFLNIKVDNLTMDEALSKIDFLIQTKEPSFVVTPNMDHIVKVEEDSEFKEVYENADLILTDGKPLIWISNILKRPIKEKISGSDIFPRICEMAAAKEYSLFILGAGKGVALKAKENLIKKYPGLKIKDVYSPTYGFENDEKEIEYICRRIKNSHADILAVALGAPKGEKFIYKWKNKYQVPLSISIGATIDFEAGRVKRAPKWMSNHGLEWAFRIIQEPKRMSKRYFNDALKIIPILIKNKNIAE